MDTKVSGSHDPGGEILHFADLAFDPAGHVLRDREGRDIPLTPAEFLLLGVFLRNPGRAFSRDELMDEVAGDAAKSYDRSIDALVARLRRKIERNPRKPELIVTLPRAGYKFAAQPRPEAAPARPPAADAAPQNDDGAGPAAPPMPATPADLAPAPQPASFAPAVQRPAERRQVTVFSCEFSGLAALAAHVDPEDLTALAQACRTCCADVIERFGGTVAHFTGDGLTAHFGYPQAHEHDAERAVRAALATIDAIAALDIGGSAKIAARVGIATGPVLAGDLDASDSAYSVVGETPALAAVLRMRAAARTVLVTPGTRRLVGGLFEYRALEPFQIDGASGPTAAFEVVADHSAGSRFLALREAGATSFVGREDEIASLERAWRQAKSGEGRVVLVSGEAGIGKSRLCAAISERVAPETSTALSFQCSPHHPDSVLYPVIAALDHAARFAREDTPDRKRAKLDALLGSDATDAALLAHLIGVPAGPLPEMTPQQRKQRTLEAVIGYFARAAVNGPLLLLFEDAHWIDPTSLELLTLLVNRVRHIPILLIITARPEFAPPWPAEGHVKVVVLSRLNRRDAAGLIQRVAAKPLPDQMVEEILARTDHVPLFIEELTKAIIEGGHLVDTGERYVLAGAYPLDTVPATLQDSLNARLDRLEYGREVAQVGAAIGREFSHALLAAVLPEEAPALSPALDELVRSELAFRRGKPPDAVYTFKHALVRDAAYGSLPRARRKICHARIAAAILRDEPDIVAVQPELLAYHCQEAGDAERSIDYWLSAGRLANDRSANNEAVSHLSKGLALLRSLPESRERDELELELLSALAPALVATKGYGTPQTVAAYERTRALMRKSRDDSARFAILAGLFAVYVTLAEHEKALDVAEESLAAAAQRNDSAALCIANRLLTVSHDMGGRFELARQHGERAWAHYDPEPHGQSAWRYAQDIGVAAGSFLAIALAHVGSLDRATSLRGEVVALAERLDHHNTIGYAHCCGAAIPAFFMRDYAALRHHAEAMQRIGRERDLPQWVSWGVCLEAPALAAAGEIERAVAQMDAGLLLRERINNRHSTRLILTGAVEVYLRAGAAAAALALTGKLLDEVSHECWTNADLWRLRADALLMSGGGKAEAEACYDCAVSIALDQGSRLLHLRAATSLARLTAEAGRRAEARELLEPVLGSFAEGFDKPDLRDARALLVDLH
jgi:class 3 adenylate cyclase/DNA-binding winged helix-turn-helix (wHTH) protein/tetratricopeptide (TPR) repeat protein